MVSQSRLSTKNFFDSLCVCEWNFKNAGCLLCEDRIRLKQSEASKKKGQTEFIVNSIGHRGSKEAGLQTVIVDKF